MYGGEVVPPRRATRVPAYSREGAAPVGSEHGGGLAAMPMGRTVRPGMRQRAHYPATPGRAEVGAPRRDSGVISSHDVAAVADASSNEKVREIQEVQENASRVGNVPSVERDHVEWRESGVSE